MSNLASAPELPGVNPAHTQLLEAGLWAPSAHNTQPWLIRPVGDDRSYELHYDQHPGLPADPDSKDAYLTMGAMAETLALQGPNYGYSVDVQPTLIRDGRDIFMATIALRRLTEGETLNELSSAVGQRHTNRNNYSGEPLSTDLESSLTSLGNTLVDSSDLADVVLDATMESWGDPEYVKDLETWFRADNSAKDGITPAAFNISRSDIFALRVAFRRGGFRSKLLQHFASDRDVKTFTSGPKAAVLTVQEKAPQEFFDAGRRLLRSWVRTVAEGYAYQPFSVTVDKPEPAARVAEIAGTEGFPVAVYRVGRAVKPVRGRSNRKPLSEVLISE